MLEKVKEYVAKWHMLEKGDKVITGVSGGADSVCLLFVLLELQKQIPFEIIVVHVNHGLRGQEADADEAYVEKLCEKYGILCETYLENVELIAKNRRQSTEEAGRNVRREAFGRTLLKYGGTKIALAHHMNDNVETFFMNLSRGTGLKGLGGIQPVSGNIIRPLLCLKREEIELFLEKNQIPFCTDSTNSSDDYTRNRVRNHLVPFLVEEINQNAVEHIHDTMEQMRDIWNFMEVEREKYLQECTVWQGAQCLVMKEAFFAIPEVIRPIILKEVLTRVAGKEKDIAAIHLKTLQSLYQKQVGKKLDMPYEIEAKRTYEGILLGKKDDCIQETEEVLIPVLQNQETEQEIYIGNQKVTCKILEKTTINGTFPQKNNTKWFDYDIIKNRLIIRKRRPGDYIVLERTPLKKQKLKSYFINEKIPQEKRNEVLLLAEEDSSHVLWIMEYRESCMYHIDRNTKRVLEIKLETQKKSSEK